MASTVVPDLVLSLESLVRSTGSGQLPPIATLCATYRVSAPTLARALTVLRQRGLISYRRGSRIVVPARATGGSPAHGVRWSARALCAELERRIGEGVYKTGAPLPKSDFFGREFGMDRRTVLRAYHLLTGKAIVHRRGRAFVVGPAAQRIRVKRGSLEQSPVMAVVVRTLGRWQDLCAADRHRNFSRAFLYESNRYGVQIQILPIQASARVQIVEPAGGPDVAETLRRLRPRLLGVLFQGTKDSVEEMRPILAEAVRTRRPVAWLDTSSSMPPSEPFPRGVTRLFYDEDRLNAAVIEFLLRRGHRRILYPYVPLTAWHVARFESLRKAVADSGEDAELVAAPSTVPATWDNPAAFVPFLERAERAAPPGFAEAASHFRSETPSLARQFPRQHASAPEGPWRGYLAYMVAFRDSAVDRQQEVQSNRGLFSELLLRAVQLTPVLSRQGPTVVLCPNDNAAQFHGAWLRKFAIDMPGRLSIAGYDNLAMDRGNPLTSADPNFGDLGYQAFHLLLGDVPVRREAGGVPIRPFVADYGTVRTIPVRTALSAE